MPKFRVHSQEMVFYVNEVEASSKEEAKSMVQDCVVDLTVCEGDDFAITLVEEI